MNKTLGIMSLVGVLAAGSALGGASTVQTTTIAPDHLQHTTAVINRYLQARFSPAYRMVNVSLNREDGAGQASANHAPSIVRTFPASAANEVFVLYELGEGEQHLLLAQMHGDRIAKTRDVY